MEITPNMKRAGVIAGMVIALVSLVSLFTPEQTNNGKRVADPVKNVFTSGGDRTLTIDAMSARIKMLEAESNKAEQQLKNTQEQINRLRETTGTEQETQRQLAQLRSKQIMFEKQQALLAEEYKSTIENLKNTIHINGAAQPQINQPQTVTAEVTLQSEKDGKTKTPTKTEEAKTSTEAIKTEEEKKQAQIAKNAEIKSIFTKTPSTEISSTKDGKGGKTVTTVSSMEIADVGEDGTITDEVGANGMEQETSFYIPMGSLMTGVLLNGLDAPTGVGANRDPFPVVVRIQKEAVLPNQFSADVVDCHAIMSGYGDLSSERVMLRAEGIACVREDGRTIEAKLEGYATGSDGKAGVRGRLVTRQSQLVARSLLAGMASGFAGAFDVTAIPVVNTGEAAQINYADNLNANTLQSGLVQGTQDSLSRIADWYLKMADAIVPVLELDAGREVDIIMTRGMKLVFK
jgi:conjugal transfer pilus assembly protein TraB